METTVQQLGIFRFWHLLKMETTSKNGENFQKWKQLLAAWNIPILATSKNGNKFQKWKQLLAAWNIPFLATSENGNNFQKWKQLLAAWNIPFLALPKMETRSKNGKNC